MNKFFSQQKSLSNFSKNKSAFTLLELVVVMMLIGIIVGGIMQGSSLVTSSRLASARSLTSKAPISNISGLIAWFESSHKNSFLGNQSFDSANISEWRDISPSSILNQKNKLTKTANKTSAAAWRRKCPSPIPALLVYPAGAGLPSSQAESKLGRVRII